MSKIACSLLGLSWLCPIASAQIALPPGFEATEVVTLADRPIAMAVPPLGSEFGTDLYVAVWGDLGEPDAVVRVDATGAATVFATLPEEADPLDLRFPPPGSVFGDPGLLTTSGPVEWLSVGPPPPSLQPGDFEDDTQARLLTERVGWTTDETIPVLAYKEGEVELQADVVPVGSRITSFLVHFDPVGADVDLTAAGSNPVVLTFDAPIRGIVVDPVALNDSDDELGTLPSVGLPARACPNAVSSCCPRKTRSTSRLTE